MQSECFNLFSTIIEKSKEEESTEPLLPHEELIAILEDPTYRLTEQDANAYIQFFNLKKTDLPGVNNIEKAEKAGVFFYTGNIHAEMNGLVRKLSWIKP